MAANAIERTILKCAQQGAGKLLHVAWPHEIAAHTDRPFGHVADGHRNNRQIAGHRLLQNVWRAFVVRREQHRVAGVHVQGHVRGRHGPKRPQFERIGRARSGPIECTLRPRKTFAWLRRIAGKEDVSTVVGPTKLATRLRPRHGPKGVDVDAVGQDV